MAGKRDEKAPKVIMLTITGPNGESWGELAAAAKEFKTGSVGFYAVSYTNLRAHETVLDFVCRLLPETTKNLCN